MTHQDDRPPHEILAETFYRAFGRGFVDARPWSSIGHDARAPFLACASEALRIAHWNRSQAWQASNPSPHTDCPDFSFPPANWQP